ncbi:MAG: RNA polymerase sigma factor [Proteobacteria bacterium]|nr:RNA polymerase sigma factor [Pseudomonadota bacterium]
MTCSATLRRDACYGRCAVRQSVTGERILDAAHELERFLKEVDRRAFRIAEIALRNSDDALDVVQESMIQLARNYGNRPAEQWKPLFYRILQNRIHDWRRRRRTRSRVIAWWTGGVAQQDDPQDPIDAAVTTDVGPDVKLEQGQAMAALEGALAALPARQQQVFLLRALEGMDVAEAAAAMGCSQGSVKTHYFRALQALRATLGEHWT